jgi:hypothetical protein
MKLKALGVLESKWDPISGARSCKLSRRLIEEQEDKVLWSSFAQKGGTRSKGVNMGKYQDRGHVRFDIYA